MSPRERGNPRSFFPVASGHNGVEPRFFNVGSVDGYSFSLAPPRGGVLPLIPGCSPWHRLSPHPIPFPVPAVRWACSSFAFAPSRLVRFELTQTTSLCVCEQSEAPGSRRPGLTRDFRVVQASSVPCWVLETEVRPFALAEDPQPTCAVSRLPLHLRRREIPLFAPRFVSGRSVQSYLYH